MRLALWGLDLVSFGLCEMYLAIVRQTSVCLFYASHVNINSMFFWRLWNQTEHRFGVGGSRKFKKTGKEKRGWG